MLDHIGLRVKDFDRAVKFYAAALEPLGYRVLMEFPGAAGLGTPGKPDLWLSQSEQVAPVHIAFSTDRDSVRAFHRAALEAGATDNGPPGLRPEYHPNYYAAFVLDPDGNNIEAVCHAPEGAKGAARPKRPVKKRGKKRPEKIVRKAKKGAAAKAGGPARPGGPARRTSAAARIPTKPKAKAKAKAKVRAKAKTSKRSR